MNASKPSIRLLFAALIFSFAIDGAHSQQRVIEKSMSADPEERVQLNLRYGETIVIRAWEKNEVSFKAVAEINQGKLNDALIVDFINEGRGIRIDVDYDKEKLKQGRREDCLDESDSRYNWNYQGGSYTICSHIVYEVFLPAKSDVSVETISGDVELYALEGPLYAKSISGFVDLSWPQRKGASISLKTVTGEAYSDLENISFNNRKDHYPHVGYELRGAIGKGGPSVKLESVSGNIYLRKGGV